MQTTLLSIIKLYQVTLSPDHGPRKRLHPYGYCRFYPTCSEYAKQAITQHGSVTGIRLSANRLIRCHPWSRGGVDLVPHL